MSRIIFFAFESDTALETHALLRVERALIFCSWARISVSKRDTVPSLPFRPEHGKITMLGGGYGEMSVHMRVRDRMTEKPVTVDAGWPVKKAYELMRESGLRRLPVLSDGKLVGIITDRDVRTLATASKVASFEKRYHNFLMEQMLISQAMTPEPRYVEPTPTWRTPRAFFSRKVGGLPVVEDGRLVGI